MFNNEKRCLFIGGDWDGTWLMQDTSEKIRMMPERTNNDFAELIPATTDNPVKESQRMYEYRKTEIGLGGEMYIVYCHGLGENEIIRKCRAML